MKVLGKRESNSHREKVLVKTNLKIVYQKNPVGKFSEKGRRNYNVYNEKARYVPATLNKISHLDP